MADVNQQDLYDTTGYDDQNDIPPSNGGTSPLTAATMAQAFIPPSNGSNGVSPLNDKNLTDILLAKSKEVAPLRPEVMAKRQVLQDAYQKLIAAQQYQAPPENMPGIAMQKAIFDASQNGNLQAWGNANEARAEQEWKQQLAEQAARQAQAGTGIEASKAALTELGQDTQQSTDLLKQASLNDYRNAMLGGKLNKTIHLPDGSQGLVNASTGQVRIVADKFGNPVSDNGQGGGGANARPQVDPEKAALASQLGVPVPPITVDPTRGMTPQGRSTYMNKLQTELQKNNATNKDIQDQLTEVDHFIDENANHKTGGWRNLPVINSIITATDPAYQTMNSLNKQFSVGPGMRPQGMRVTQGEWNVFRQAVQSTSNLPEANTNIANAMKAKLQRDLDYNNFMNDYVSVNGHAALADNYFNQYMKDNPIFSTDANSKNNFKLNPNRMSYQDYFAKKGLDINPASSQTSVNQQDANVVATAAKGNNSAIQRNNPGNVRNGPNDTFAPAATPEEGIATTASNLLAYQDKHGINTINDIVKRWAPPIDKVTGKPNNVPAYIADVSQTTGYKPDQKLDLHDPQTLYNVTNAMIKHENGKNPYHPLQLTSGVQTALQKSQQLRLAQASPQEIADELRKQGVIQ